MMLKTNLLILMLVVSRKKNIYDGEHRHIFLWISTSISWILKPLRHVMEKRKETHNPGQVVAKINKNKSASPEREEIQIWRHFFLRYLRNIFIHQIS